MSEQSRNVVFTIGNKSPSDDDVIVIVDQTNADEEPKNPRSDKSRYNITGSKSQKSLSNQRGKSPRGSTKSVNEEDEIHKNEVLKQISAVTGGLQRRSSKSVSDLSSGRRRHSRKPSASSVDSSVSKGSGSEASGDAAKDRKTKRVDYIKQENETRKHRDNFCSKVSGVVANMDAAAAKVQTPRYDLCIVFSLVLIPILLIIMIWDLLAVFVFEIPHISMIDHPGFMLVFHFITIPSSMYGLMMRLLMNLENTKFTTLGKFSLITNLILLIIRAMMEHVCEGFQSQQSHRYESY